MSARKKNAGWIRSRFYTKADDCRPVKFPPPGPWWCSGYAGDCSYSILIAYTRTKAQLRKYWPEAYNVESRHEDSIVFTDRFPRPDWWTP